jgi:fructose-1,6-bisphosphatase I / sedoheptulose-1,7-bisphosphatase
LLIERTTLSQFLIEERRRHSDASGALNSLILDVAVAIKAIAARLARTPFSASVESPNPSPQPVPGGQPDYTLDVASNRIMLRTAEWGGQVCGMVSEKMTQPYQVPDDQRRGDYLLCYEPLDGFANIDINLSVGTLFSILRSPRPGQAATAEDFLQSGAQQMCAGYAWYGPSTMLVLSVGRGVHGFTLEPSLGEFILTHPDITIPAGSGEFAINAGDSRFWNPAVRRYVDECLDGATGVRGKNFTLRWIGAVVGDCHRVLMRGGVCLYPQDKANATLGGRVRLLFEANPIAFLIEQAGGRASTGEARILDVVPTHVQQHDGLIFGDAGEVARIERYHNEPAEPGITECEIPLYGTRGLFRASG